MRRRTLYGAAVLLVLVLLLMLLAVPKGEDEEEREWTSSSRQGRFPCDEYKGRCLPQLIIAGLFKGGTSQLSYDLGHCHPEAISNDRFGVEPFGIEERNLRVFSHVVPKVTAEDEKLLVVKMPKVAHYEMEDLLYLKEVVPSVKLVVMLRNPVDRDYSHFRMILGRWNARGMEGVQLPKTCMLDSNRCFFNLILRYVLIADEEWSACALENAEKEFPLDADVEGWETTAGGVPLGVWIHCVRTIPKADWRKKIVVIDQEYTNRLRNLYEVFGEERVLLVRSEDFFAGKEGCIEEIQEFAGLSVDSNFQQCTRELGSAKAEVEPVREEEHGIHITPLTPGVRALMNALHHLNVKEVEEFIGRELHWT